MKRSLATRISTQVHSLLESAIDFSSWAKTVVQGLNSEGKDYVRRHPEIIGLGEGSKKLDLDYIGKNTAHRAHDVLLLLHRGDVYGAAAITQEEIQARVHVEKTTHGLMQTIHHMGRL